MKFLYHPNTVLTSNRPRSDPRNVSFDEACQSACYIELWSEKPLPDYIFDEGELAADPGCNVVVKGEGDLSLPISQTESRTRESRP